MRKKIDDHTYVQCVTKTLTCIEQEEYESIQRAAEAAYVSMRSGGLLHVFASGHSHMIMEEMFYRSGGLLPVNPIFVPPLMLHEGAITSTKMERIPGKAREILSAAGLRAGETILISSNSGINSVPVEAALYAKELGLTVVGITSVTASSGLEPRNESRKHLFEVCDIVIDNHAPEGDSYLTLPESKQRTGGASTFGSLFIAQRIVLMIENKYIEDGVNPPIFMSANIPGGDEHNRILIEQYKERVRCLR